MGRINIEIPDELHDKIRTESAVKRVPIKLLVTQAIREHAEQTELSVNQELL